MSMVAPGGLQAGSCYETYHLLGATEACLSTGSLPLLQDKPNQEEAYYYDED